MRITIEIDDEPTLQEQHEQFLAEWLEGARDNDEDGGDSALMALLEVAGSFADEITGDE